MPGERLRNAEGRGNVLRTMHASNKPQDAASQGLAAVEPEFAGAVRDLWHGCIGTTVRCVPSRRTVVTGATARRLFGKWRHGQRRMAAAEWRWLHLLPPLGFTVPQPVAWVAQGARSLLVTAELPGRAVDAWANAAMAEGWLDELVRWVVARVAPAVRALHAAGLVYRDLYWNHVFTVDPRADATPAFLDVERVFAPRWRRRRWVIKDLAGLLASAPSGLGCRAPLRFLRAYLGESTRRHRGLVRAIERKASRIRRRPPRYG